MNGSLGAHAADPVAIEATTASGEHVRVLSIGRREYVDAAKAETPHAVAQAYEQQHDDERAREEGGLPGIGRKIKPGGPDDNRGSLGGRH